LYSLAKRALQDYDVSCSTTPNDKEELWKERGSVLVHYELKEAAMRPMSKNTQVERCGNQLQSSNAANVVRDQVLKAICNHNRDRV